MTVSEHERLLARLATFIETRRFGKHRGIVREVGADDRLGYLRAEVPDVYGEQLSPWAKPAVPLAGDGHGWAMMPAEEDGVWIEFEQGDISSPIWTGFWWARDEMPDGAAPATRVLASPAGHRIVLDDDGGEIRIEHADGPSISLTGDEITVQVGGKKIVVSKSAVDVNDGNLKVT